MEEKKYGRNPDEENGTKGKGADKERGKGKPDDGGAVDGPSGSRAPSAEPEGKHGDGFDYSEAMATSRYNVQVRIGPNGETIIDEASLFVDRHEEEDTEEYTHIEESDTSKFVNSATYSKKLRGSRWSAEETDLFYDVSLGLEYLSMCACTHVFHVGTISVRRELRADIAHSTWAGP